MWNGIETCVVSVFHVGWNGDMCGVCILTQIELRHVWCLYSNIIHVGWNRDMCGVCIPI